MSWLQNIHLGQITFVRRGAVRDPENPDEPMPIPLAKAEGDDSPHSQLKAHFHTHGNGTQHVHAHRHSKDGSHDTMNHGHGVAKEQDCECGCQGVAKAALSGGDRSALPDSAFGYVEPGHKGPDGKTPDKYRHYPLHDEEHVRKATQLRNSPFFAKARGKIMAAARKYGITMSKEELVRGIEEMLSSESPFAAPLAKELGEDAVKAILGLADEGQPGSTETPLSKSEKPTSDNPDPDGDGDDDTSPAGDKDHSHWNADGTPTPLGKSVGLSKVEDPKIDPPEAPKPSESVAKSETVTISKAEWDASQAKVAKAEQRAEAAELVAKEEREIRVKREYLAKAEQLKHVPGLSSEEMADVLRRAYETSPEAGEKLEASFKATNEAISKSELLTEKGSSANRANGVGAHAQLQAKAVEIAKEDPKKFDSREKAYAEAMVRFPELYQQYKREQNAAAREAN